MATKGDDILLMVNTGTSVDPAYEAVGSQRDVNFDESSEEIDVSNKNTRSFGGLPGRYKSTLNLDALYIWADAGYQALRNAKRNGSKILVARMSEGVIQETVEAIVTSMSDTFPDSAEATISVSLTIDGEWVRVVLGL